MFFFVYIGFKRANMPKTKTKKKRAKRKPKMRPPRVYRDARGPYIRRGGKRIRVKSDMSNAELIKMVIKYFLRRKTRRRKKKKAGDAASIAKRGAELEAFNRRQSQRYATLQKLEDTESRLKQERKLIGQKEAEIDRKQAMILAARPNDYNAIADEFRRFMKALNDSKMSMAPTRGQITPRPVMPTGPRPRIKGRATPRPPNYPPPPLGRIPNPPTPALPLNPPPRQRALIEAKKPPVFMEFEGKMYTPEEAIKYGTALMKLLKEEKKNAAAVESKLRGKEVELKIKERELRKKEVKSRLSGLNKKQVSEIAGIRYNSVAYRDTTKPEMVDAILLNLGTRGTKRLYMKIEDAEDVWAAGARKVYEMESKAAEVKRKEEEDAEAEEIAADAADAEEAKEEDEEEDEDEEEGEDEDEEPPPPPLEDDTTGKGLGKMRGLLGSEINDLMSAINAEWYIGLAARDKIKDLQPGDRRQFGFVMNTDRAKGPGIHWVGVWVDLDHAKSIEYYDPLGIHPPRMFQYQIKSLIPKNLPYYLKFKTNLIRNQHAKTDTCGWHSIKFLIHRSKGKDWKFCTGYYDNTESEIKKFKNVFGYI